MGIRTIAVCTTIYPGAELFLSDWYSSVRNQTYMNFQLWIALDGLGVNEVAAVLGETPEANWVRARRGDTPAAVRQRLLAPVVDSCDGVVLVDSDDILHPDRVKLAHKALGSSDLVACAVRLVDQKGADLGKLMTLDTLATVDSVLPRHNIFGFSNTAWRCSLLKKCLPIPAEAEIVDWLVATRAWLLGARLQFDNHVGMDYRQHDANFLGIGIPFSTKQVRRDTHLARRHYAIAISQASANVDPQRLETLKNVAAEAQAFANWINSDPSGLDTYISELNTLSLPPIWWVSIANPELRHMWAGNQVN